MPKDLAGRSYGPVGDAGCILLCLANRAFDHWAWWGMAGHTWCLLPLPSRSPGACRGGYRMGMDRIMASERVCQAGANGAPGLGIRHFGFRSFAHCAVMGAAGVAKPVRSLEPDTVKGWCFKTGIGGSAFTLVCCFTPFLPWLFSILGISSVLGYVYRDDVLFSILAGFLLLTGYAIWRSRRLK